VSSPRLALVVALVLVSGASCARRIPLPRAYEATSAAALAARMSATHSPLHGYSAEVRVTYFGPEGRIRTGGTLAVQRPASLRYEVSGPHGGVVTAFATNGLELQALEVASSHFLYGPATPANLDLLLPFAPLRLGAPAWVSLLFGEAEVPQEATLTYDDRTGRFVLAWPEGPTVRRLEVDPATARVARAVALEGERVLSQVSFEERDGRGVPTSLHLSVASEKVELEVKLRDLEPDPELDASVFTLEPPAGVAPQHL
jgi:hypothetical protein